MARDTDRLLRGTDLWVDHDDVFHPTRQEGPLSVALSIILGPLTWAIVLAVAAHLTHQTRALYFGLSVALIAFALSLVLLSLLRLRRDREEERYRQPAGR